MKRVFLSTLLVLFICSGAYAESSVWKIQKGSSVLYVGATIHILRDSDFPLPPEFERAYKASQTVVLETDLRRLENPAVQAKLMLQAAYTDGSTIEQHLSPDTYRELSDFCESNGIPLPLLGTFKPSVVILTLTTMELMKLGVTQEGVDAFFSGKAVKDGKKVEGLETAEEQIHYLATMADGIEDTFVRYSIRDMKNLEQQFGELAGAWRKGDNEKLERLVVHELGSSQPRLYQRLIVDRNRKWLPLIEAYLRTPQTEFVLVGAAHVVGPDGLLAALKKKGYTVKKL